MRSEDETGVEIGKVYEFKWIKGRELTGVATEITGKERWITLRTKKSMFKVPPQNIIKEVSREGGGSSNGRAWVPESRRGRGD